MGKFIKSYKAGAVQASIFENEITTESGKIEKAFNIVVKKNYVDKNGEWADTNSYYVNDMANVELVCAKAREFCVLREGAAKETENSQDS